MMIDVLTARTRRCLWSLTVGVLLLCCPDISLAAIRDTPEGVIPTSDSGDIIEWELSIQPHYPGVTVRTFEKKADAGPSVFYFYPEIGNTVIDKIIENRIMRDADEFFQAASSGDGYEQERWHHFSNYTVFWPSPEVISISFYFGGFMGGAVSHGYTESYAYNVSNGRQLGLQDMFGKPKTALKLLSTLSRQLVAAQIAEEHSIKVGAYMKEKIAAGTTPEESNFDALQLLPRGIKIYFARYQLGAGYLGSPEIEIPIRLLADAEPNSQIWGKPDLKKIALETPLVTPLPSDASVAIQHKTFLVPVNGEEYAMPCRRSVNVDDEQCIVISPSFTMYTDGQSEDFAFVSGMVTVRGITNAYVWGMYSVPKGFKATPPVSLGASMTYNSVRTKDNIIFFSEPMQNSSAQQKASLKLKIKNGVLESIKNN